MTTTVLPPGASWSMRDVRRAFARLTAPEVPELTGRWEGVFVGHRGLRRLTAAIAAMSPLRGWCGKEIGESGEVRNLVRRGGAIEKSVAAVAGRGDSLLDGRPAVIVDYSRTAKPPLSWVRGELRWLEPGHEILGVLIFPLGKRRIGPFPFRMTRSAEAGRR